MPKTVMGPEASAYTSLAALSSDWYWEQDGSFRFTRIVRSPSAQPLDDFNMSLSIGRRRWDLPGARALSMTWDQHRADLKARQPFRDFRYAAFCGPLAVMYLSTSGEPVFDAGGRLAGYRGTARDIPADWVSDQRLCDAQAQLQTAIKVEHATESRQTREKNQLLSERLSVTLQTMTKIGQLNAALEEEIRVRTAELEALAEEMKTFSFSVAHDLRSPLAAISGFGQLLEKEDGPDVSPRRRHLLSRIRAAAHQMEEMTQGLLALARLSPATMRPRPIDLGRIAAALLEKIRERDPHRDVEVHVMDNLRGQGDTVLLTQALSNLLSNAWKFTARQAHARIEVGSQGAADGETVYFVKDNGAGFDMNYAARLFGVFSRLHTAAEFEGTGIGLAIVKKVIDRHGGRIWAQSVLDQGACFYFTLKTAAGPQREAIRSDSPASLI